MHRIKQIKEEIINCVQSQVNGNMSTVDTKELGQAIDMIKDLSEAIYYCSIVEAMEENKKEQEIMNKIEPMMMRNKSYYTPYYRYPDYRYDDNDYERGRLYYTGGRGGNSSSGGNNGGNSGGRNSFTYMMDREAKYPSEYMRDSREGRSPSARKAYMEGKQMHHQPEKQIQELDRYMKELASDITEMIEDATPEEKTMLQQKLNTLVTKIK